MDEDISKKLQIAMAQLEKQFGKNTVVRLGDQQFSPIESISTGSPTIDYALGIGGVPVGRIIEVFGGESSGKSSLALSLTAEAQKKGLTCLYIDAEHALDLHYARTLGVDVESLLFAQPTTGEEAMTIVDHMTNTGTIGLIVVDSVAALTPRAEMEGEIGQNHVGLLPRLMAQSLRKITANLNQTGTTIVFINQIREKIGVMYGCLHGNTKIPLADGGCATIKEIVDNKIKAKVWSFNEETKEFEKKEIVDWHFNGNTESKSDWIHIKSRGIGTKNGIFGITVTPDHEIMTESGWKKAKDIKLGEKVLTKYINAINGTVGDFLSCVFVGDSNVHKRGTTASLRLQDNTDPEYVRWKVKKLANFSKFRTTPQIKQHYTEVFFISEGSEKQMKNPGKYDISIDGNSNYLAGNKENGILVHNSPETQPGGRALKFYTSVRIELRKKEILKDANGEVNGVKTRIKVIKNKVGPPLREAEFDIYYGKGIDQLGGLCDLALEKGIIKMGGGGWIKYNDENVCQGKAALKQRFIDDKEFHKEIYDQVFATATEPETNAEESVEDEL